jgi:hypothetical protein
VTDTGLWLSCIASRKATDREAPTRMYRSPRTWGMIASFLGGGVHAAHRRRVWRRVASVAGCALVSLGGHTLRGPGRAGRHMARVSIYIFR